MFGLFKKEKITSFEKVIIRESGMRVCEETEILFKEGKAEITKYLIRYASDKDVREPMAKAECDSEEFIETLNKFNVMSWDGFSGKHPKGIKDGIMLHFEAYVNDGKKIRAEGSQNFPKNYRELRDWLRKKLGK